MYLRRFLADKNKKSNTCQTFGIRFVYMLFILILFCFFVETSIKTEIQWFLANDTAYSCNTVCNNQNLICKADAWKDFGLENDLKVKNLVEKSQTVTDETKFI